MSETIKVTIEQATVADFRRIETRTGRTITSAGRSDGRTGPPAARGWSLSCRADLPPPSHRGKLPPCGGTGPSRERWICGVFRARPSHAENFSEKPEKHTIFCLNSATPRRPGGPAPAAIAADHRAPAGGAAGRKTENGRNRPVDGEQEQDDHRHAHRPGTRLQARVGPSAGGCAAGTLARGRTVRFKISIERFRFLYFCLFLETQPTSLATRRPPPPTAQFCATTAGPGRPSAKW